LGVALGDENEVLMGTLGGTPSEKRVTEGMNGGGAESSEGY